MDENSTKDCNSSSQIYPFLRGHQLSSYTGSGGGTVGGAAPHRASSLPSSAYDLAGTQLPILACSDGEDASFSQGFGSDSLVHVQGGEPSEADLDGYDCESKEGVEVAEGPVKPAAHRSSGSKRSRAAEVHNLSEKRRRSRINEKMKALQKLIPNSNKTDKASMLDEAIDYLKQLQLQVQMLSMRNGLTLHPTYISGAMQSLQSSQIRLPFGADNPSSLTNLGMGMLPVGLDSSNPNSFNLPNHVTSSHQPLVPGVSNINEPVSSYGMETSDPRHGFFHLPGIPSEGAYTEDMVSHRLNQAESMRPGAEINSLAATPPLPFNGRPHLLEANHLDSQILNQGGSRENLSKDQDTQTHIQHLHGIGRGPDHCPADVKAEKSDS